MKVHIHNMRGLVGVVFVAVFLVVLSKGVDGAVQLTGVNLSGAEDGSGDIPGAIFHNYVWCTEKDAAYFLGKEMNVYRVPFLWERMQLVAGGPLVGSQLQYLQNIVSYITLNQSKYVLIDPHNYGSGYGGKIGQSATSISLYADFWYKLALVFKNNPRVIFGLMNEPNNQNVTIWRDAAQRAIDAIRYAGATNIITVPGVDWTGAWTWMNENAGVMGSITDPVNNFLYEVHQYLDVDSSGTHTTCVNETIGAERLKYFTGWARSLGRKAILGEFGGGRDPICGAALANMLTFMDQNDDVWAGWTYWAGGPWWGDSYFSNLSPNATGVDRPQMPYIQPHINNNTVVPKPIPANGGSYTPPSEFAVYTQIYSDGQLESPYQDYSWAHHTLSNTTVVAPGSSKSISFDVSNYGALWFKCQQCLDSSKQFSLNFMFNAGDSGDISHIGLYLMNNSAKVSAKIGISLGAFAITPSTKDTWVQVAVPLGWWVPAQYDGLQIQGNVGGTVGVMFLDDIKLVAYHDSYNPTGITKANIL